MPRDLPVGNGRLLVTFDDQYQLRDLYFPHVGQDNHAGASPCHFGVWAEMPRPKGRNESAGKLAWTSDDGFQRRLRYLDDALTTDVDLWHDELQISLHCNDVVDFNRNVLVRKVRVHNRLDSARLVKLFHHNDFLMFGTRIGDTAYYDPELKSMVHYRGKRYLSATFFEEHGNGGEYPVSQRVDEYATGTSGFGGAEGTYRDAEDGKLGMNPIAQGAVDATMSINVHLAPGETRTLYMAIIAGKSRDEVAELHRWLTRQTPGQVVKRTTDYWRLWSQGAGVQFGDLSEPVVKMFKRSLLTVRTQIDDEGAILAANDSDIMQFARDTYSYMWPRDGALVADALDLCGFSDLARNFYSFCQRVIQPEGYFLHKYNPDGSPASSWHPWIKDGEPSLPIQEDETALVVWAMWRHYWRYRDTEYVRPLWIDVVIPAADFMCAYRDDKTGLPLPSYDLWEERWGIHAFTVATVYGGLIAARNFAVSFGDSDRAEKYGKAAAEIREAAAKYLWSDRLGRFARRLVPTDAKRPPQEPHYEDPEAETLHEKPDCDGLFEVDDVIDASLFAIYKF
ncbi:MAG: glycoside hydrolase family 15 protein, partial [Planctomycetota bacterium]